MLRNFGKVVRSPVLGLPDRSRRHDNEFGAMDDMLAQQRVNAGTGRLWNRKRKVGRTFIQTKDRADIQVTVDGVEIERGNGNVVRVGQPTAFSRALPGMLTRF